MPNLEDYSPQNAIVPFDTKDAVSDEGVFKGFGTIFDDKPDTSMFRDVIMPGAFQKTIKRGGRNGNGIVMLSQHGQNDLNPIGIWSHIAETSKGLEMTGELITDGSKHAINGKGTILANETHVLMKAKALRGLSIGFDFPRKRNGQIKDGVIEWDKEKERRLIKEVDLWETSPVTFPAKLNANITTVKSIFEAKTERELERALHGSGLSNKESMYVVKLCKQSLRESKEMPKSINMILDGLMKLNKDIKGD
jgi:HK97 family phage prohead protease